MQSKPDDFDPAMIIPTRVMVGLRNVSWRRSEIRQILIAKEEFFNELWEDHDVPADAQEKPMILSDEEIQAVSATDDNSPIESWVDDGVLDIERPKPRL